MSADFVVGEVVLFHGLLDWRAPYNSTECCITGGLMGRYGHTSKKEALCYEVHAALDGKKWLVEPNHLRRKPPPANYIRQELGEWDLCPWRPAKEIA